MQREQRLFIRGLRQPAKRIDVFDCSCRTEELRAKRCRRRCHEGDRNPFHRQTHVGGRKSHDLGNEVLAHDCRGIQGRHDYSQSRGSIGPAAYVPSRHTTKRSGHTLDEYSKPAGEAAVWPRRWERPLQARLGSAPPAVARSRDGAQPSFGRRSKLRGRLDIQRPSDLDGSLCADPD